MILPIYRIKLINTHRSTRQAEVYVAILCSEHNYNLKVNPLETPAIDIKNFDQGQES